MQQAHAFRLAVVAPSGRSHPARAPCAHRFATRRRNLLCRAVVGGDSDTKPTDAVKVEVDSLKKKVSLLDAVLGTQDEPAKTPAAPLAAVKVRHRPSSHRRLASPPLIPSVQRGFSPVFDSRLETQADEASTSTSKVEISSDLWAQMKAADAARDGAKKDTSSSTDAEMGKILDSMKVRSEHSLPDSPCATSHVGRVLRPHSFPPRLLVLPAENRRQAGSHSRGAGEDAQGMEPPEWAASCSLKA